MNSLFGINKTLWVVVEKDNWGDKLKIKLFGNELFL